RGGDDLARPRDDERRPSQRRAYFPVQINVETPGELADILGKLAILASDMRRNASDCRGCRCSKRSKSNGETRSSWESWPSWPLAGAEMRAIVEGAMRPSRQSRTEKRGHLGKVGHLGFWPAPKCERLPRMRCVQAVKGERRNAVILGKLVILASRSS